MARSTQNSPVVKGNQLWRVPCRLLENTNAADSNLARKHARLGIPVAAADPTSAYAKLRVFHDVLVALRSCTRTSHWDCR
jgi:hypothetical protein